jgi:hypothetical protein
MLSKLKHSLKRVLEAKTKRQFFFTDDAVHTWAADFFQGGGGSAISGGEGVKFVDPIFNGQFFSKKNNLKFFFQKNKKYK